MIYRYTLTLFCALFLTSLTVSAQIFGGTKALNIPSSYEYPQGPTGFVARSDAARGSHAWVVFSDRADNAVYSDAACSKQKTKVPYLQAFYVIEENNAAVKVVEYKPPLSRTGHINKKVNMEQYGWIKKTNLLLWSQSMIDDNTKFRVKAFAIYKPEAIKNPGKYVTNNQIHLYNSPTLNKESKNNNALRIFQFLFVLKHDKANKSLLIAKKEQLGFLSPETHVLGWVSESLVQTWKERLCLEPNSDSEASEERKSKNLKASIYMEKKDAHLIHFGEASKNNPLWANDKFDKKMSPYEKRFPVIEKNDDVYKTGYTTGLISDAGVTLSSPEAKAIFDEKYNEVRKQVSQINVIYVIDGNQENKSYMQPVLTSINESYNKFKDNTENTYHFGAVIYRRKAFKKCSIGDKSLASRDLTSNYHSISNFVKTEITQEMACNPPIRGYTNLNEAISRAARMFGSANTTNVIIVIGGAGSNDPAFNNKTITQKCIQKNISVLAFQVNHNGSDPFESFYDGMRSIITNAARGIATKSNNPKLGSFKPRFESMGDNKYNLLNAGIFGSLVFVERGAELGQTVLIDELRAAVNSLEKSNNQLMAKTDSEFQGIGASDIKFDPQLLLFLKKMNLTAKEIETFLSTSKDHESYSFFIEGYAPNTVSNLEHSLFEQVILIDADEWAKLENSLSKLAKAQSNANENDVRTEFYNAYKEILATHYGRKQAKYLLKNNSIKEINELISGVSYQGDNLLSKLKIDDILDESMFPRNQLFQYIQLIEEKKDLIKSMATTDVYKFISFNEEFYWMPASFLP